MVKFGKAGDFGGAAFDSSGQIEGSSSGVWTVVAVPSDGSSGIFVSLHTTEGGARARLSERADLSGDVNWCEVETP